MRARETKVKTPRTLGAPGRRRYRHGDNGVKRGSNAIVGCAALLCCVLALALAGRDLEEP